MHGPVMIERGTATEVTPLDKRRLQPPKRCVVGEREPVDAASDNQDVERFAGEPRRIARHADGAVKDRIVKLYEL
jgi:hypothetical protein